MNDWTTEDEIDFMRGIGKYRWITRKERQERTRNPPRLDVLRGYLAGARRRRRWDRIDKARAIEAAELEIENERRKQAMR